MRRAVSARRLCALGFSRYCSLTRLEAVTCGATCWESGDGQDEECGSFVLWWPTEIEGMAEKCELYLQSHGLPPVAPVHPTSWPSAPWSRIHLDYAGPIAGQMFLVLIDAHTKWLELFQVSAANSNETIRQLRTTFARFGLPHTVVTGNGSCFTSEEFGIIMTKNGVRHVKTALYHSSSNEQAEHAVQVFKNGFKKLKDGTMSDHLDRFLFSYRYSHTALLVYLQLS